MVPLSDNCIDTKDEVDNGHVAATSATIGVDHERVRIRRWVLRVFLAMMIGPVLLVNAFMFLYSELARQHISHTKVDDEKISYRFHILHKSSLCCPSGRYFCCQSQRHNGEASNLQMIIHAGKPVAFEYPEILSSTADLSDSNILCNGTYGPVYYGILRDQEVVIKQMTTGKSIEFMVDMCSVHATEFELMGYATFDFQQFIIYEYAVKGSFAQSS